MTVLCENILTITMNWDAWNFRHWFGLTKEKKGGGNDSNGRKRKRTEIGWIKQMDDPPADKERDEGNTGDRKQRILGVVLVTISRQHRFP